MKGAAAKKKANVITGAQFDWITKIVKLADSREFKRLRYVMAYRDARQFLPEVEPEDNARALWSAYII